MEDPEYGQAEELPSAQVTNTSSLGGEKSITAKMGAAARQSLASPGRMQDKAKKSAVQSSKDGNEDASVEQTEESLEYAAFRN